MKHRKLTHVLAIEYESCEAIYICQTSVDFADKFKGRPLVFSEASWEFLQPVSEPIEISSMLQYQTLTEDILLGLTAKIDLDKVKEAIQYLNLETYLDFLADFYTNDAFDEDEMDELSEEHNMVSFDEIIETTELDYVFNSEGNLRSIFKESQHV